VKYIKPKVVLVKQSSLSKATIQTLNQPRITKPNLKMKSFIIAPILAMFAAGVVADNCKQVSLMERLTKRKILTPSRALTTTAPLSSRRVSLLYIIYFGWSQVLTFDLTLQAITASRSTRPWPLQVTLVGAVTMCSFPALAVLVDPLSLLRAALAAARTMALAEAIPAAKRMDFEDLDIGRVYDLRRTRVK
jgi:hypothetical protein